MPAAMQMSLADLSCAEGNKPGKRDECCVPLVILCSCIVKFGETEATVVVAKDREGGGIGVI